MVIIKTIKHSWQRYDTAGDWWFDKKGDLQIRRSKLPDERYEWLIGVHEHIEAYLCNYKKIKEKDVTKFDLKFLKEKHKEGSEPGNSPRAPYFWQHQVATLIERIFAFALGVSWRKYSKAVIKL